MSEPTRVRRRAAVRLSLLATGVLGIASALVWSGTLSNSESLLLRSYQIALAETDAGSNGLNVTPAALGDIGDQRAIDAIWPGKQSQAFRRPLAVGDRVMITSRDGKPDRLSVVQVDLVDGAAVGAPGVRFQLVTSRLEGSPDGGLVRFLIAVDPANTVQPAAADKTL